MNQPKRKLYWVLLIGITCIGVIGLVWVRAYTEQNKENTSLSTKAVPVAALSRPANASTSYQKPEQRRPLSNLVALPIAVRMNGFTPAEITKPAGDFFLAVSNLTSLPDFILRLDREEGRRLDNVKVQKETRAWRQTVHLTEGTYLLTVKDHPDWICRIIITAP